MDRQAITALLFDKDGTLFDFDKSWRAFGRRVIFELGGGEPDLMMRLAVAAGVDPETGGFKAGSPIVAGAVDDIIDVWLPLLDQWEREPLAAWLLREAEMMDPATMAPAADDLVALLAQLRREGYALGVLTNDGEAAARKQLAAAGVLEAFDFIAGFDSGFRAKPAPDGLLGFAEQVGRPTAAVAMIGDSTHDLATAQAAGAGAAIGVLTGPAGEADLAPYADAVLPSIAALPAWLADA